MRTWFRLTLVACFALLSACAASKPQPLGEIASEKTNETIDLAFADHGDAYKVEVLAHWRSGAADRFLYPDGFRIDLLAKDGQRLPFLCGGVGGGSGSGHSCCQFGTYAFARSVPRDEVAEAVVTLGTIEKRFAVPRAP